MAKVKRKKVIEFALQSHLSVWTPDLSTTDMEKIKGIEGVDFVMPVAQGLDTIYFSVTVNRCYDREDVIAEIEALFA